MVRQAHHERKGDNAHLRKQVLEQIREQVDKEGVLSPAYFPLLINLDPALLDFCRKSIERARRFAVKWLLNSQCIGDQQKAEKIATQLSDNRHYLSHGAVIDHQEARDLGLRVAYFEPEDDFWRRLWRLYTRYEVDARAEGFTKIFESDSVSLPVVPPGSS